ncbi:MAG TPA: tRNA (adenosine(37)-N6)-threonylcarbamoyltransferase complex dimerization subunit type 1 TsaB, partial [Rhizomicrobium sp.]|nr:tRNA (adenosine(37)-N6)-threonylcarbamoyltransferase complex dimerization subunit type 1 TsaB [Rhizomicrobium sp.]
MRILAADTALGACSVAVLDGDRVLAHCWVEMERGHAEALAPMVDDAIRASGIAFDLLDRLSVTTGPGTFTGQRVGLAFMRGLRVALRKPLVGVTTLAAMQEAAKAETGLTRAVALHDARRGEVYLEVAGVPVVLSFADAIAVLMPLQNGLALAGTAAEQAKAELPGATLSTIRQPDA